MSRVRIVSICIAAMALAGMLASPAAAERFPEGPSGQPAISGHLGEPEVAVAHCQSTLELLTGAEFQPGTYPGGIVLLPNGKILQTSPGVRPCPLVLP